MKPKLRARLALMAAVLIAFGITAIVLERSLHAAEPLHTYLTYSGPPETSIDINVVTTERVSAVNVHYDTVSRGGDPAAYTNHQRAEYHRAVVELSDERAIYVAPLTGLKPGTDYYFVTENEENGVSQERKFRTLPGGDKPFRFVNGGDMGADGLVVPLLKLAAKTDPDFGLIGGDLAYENGLLAANRTWDRWLKNWSEYMVTSDGRMVPLVTAIGNHETNDYQSTDLEMQSPWYTAFFGRQGEHVYWTFHVGDNAVFYLLDSGHLIPHAGAQTDWLKAELEKNKGVRHQFAAYHVPLYPAHRAYDGDYSVRGRTHWAPLFDAYQLDIALEHHDHVFKRSKPLKGNQVVKQGEGTIYLGDGCFGRAPRTVDPKPRWYNEKELAVGHFWVIDVSKDKLKFEAIDDQGRSIDTFSLPTR